jgi:hypothetical protein
MTYLSSSGWDVNDHRRLVCRHTDVARKLAMVLSPSAGLAGYTSPCFKQLMCRSPRLKKQARLRDGPLIKLDTDNHLLKSVQV